MFLTGLPHSQPLPSVGSMHKSCKFMGCLAFNSADPKSHMDDWNANQYCGFSRVPTTDGAKFTSAYLFY